jgi:hypothetical protein
MVGVRRLRTQTEAFWRHEYTISEADLDLITGLVLEAGKPQSLETLSAAIVLHRHRLEQEASAQQNKTGQVYRPMDSYQVGSALVFSEMALAEGVVTVVREGQNPRYGPFSVIRVALADGSEREFAAAFDHPHPLNRPIEELLSSGQDDLTDEQLAEVYGPYVALRIEKRLQALPDWVRLNGLWFLSGLLPEIHVGHLNLAEAIIYEAGHPVAATDMLKDSGLEAASSEAARLFALNHALAGDQRFDNVSTGEERVWYLRALEPQAVFARPDVLLPAFVATPDDHIGLTMVDLVEEIGDELDIVEHSLLQNTRDLRCEVTFPHLYAGTLPFSWAFARLVNQEGRRHFPLTLVDGRTGRRIEVWVVPEHGYMCGLGDWFAAVGMCVGGQVTFGPTDEPQAFTIGVMPARSTRSEWVRTASVAEARLMLQMQRAAVAVRYDPNTFVDVPDRQAVAQLMTRSAAANTSLPVLIRYAFQELTKLGDKGFAHAKSIYSVVNLHRRAGAAPVFAALTRNACYDPVGDGQWAFDPNLVGKVYETPEEMMERPLSARTMRTRDQVTRYLGL